MSVTFRTARPSRRRPGLYSNYNFVALLIFLLIVFAGPWYVGAYVILHAGWDNVAAYLPMR